MLESVIAFTAIALLIGGAAYGLYSVFRYFIKKDITPFPIILGGSIFLAGIWLIFILGILETNNQEAVTDFEEESMVAVTEDENEPEPIIEAEEPQEVEEVQEPSVEEFLQEVQPEDPISNYEDYMELYELQINRGYTVYGREFDEVTIENRNIIVVYDADSIIEVGVNKDLDQVKNAHVKRIQEDLTTTIEGSSDMGTDALQLERGFAVVESSYNGSSNFAVTLQNAQGQMIDLLVNEIGEYSGKSFVWIEDTGDYYLNINGNQGNWIIKVMQYRPLEVANLPGDIKGTGDDVVFFEVDKGSYQISFSHNGDSNFAVTVNKVDLLVNEIGNYEGSQRYSFEESSIYVFVVTADGDWSINVKE